MPSDMYAGGGDPLYEQYNQLRRSGRLGDYTNEARAYAQALQAAGAGGPGSWSEPMLQGAITQKLQSPGMDAVTYAQAKGNVLGNFRAATRGIGGRSAGSGSFNPDTAGSMAGGAPSTALSQGLGQVEVENEKMKREDRQQGLEALGQIAPVNMGRADAYSNAVGGTVGDFVRSRNSNPYFRVQYGQGYLGGGY